jgi:glycerol kinase
MPFILALDQGTTSSRALLFDHHGSIQGIAQQEFTQHFPHPGWVEHDANEIWLSQLAVARQVLAKTGISASQVAAIGITNQRETTVLWDRKTGEPLAPAIVWQDRRTADTCAALQASGKESLIRQKTGLHLDPYFSATKLAWLLDHVPDARTRAESGELAFGTIDSWLAWKLTGGAAHVTDASNASRTLLFNIHTGAWDEELLALLNIPQQLLPTVVGSSEVIGSTTVDCLGSAIPIAGIAGDQQAATFGQACLQPGMAKNTYGTGCFMLMNTGRVPVVSSHRLLTTVAWQQRRTTSTNSHCECEITYALEGSVFMGGAIVQWLRDGLGIITNAAEIEALASSVPDCGGVTLVPAFSGLGAPWWQADARATLSGMTRGTSRAHIARAALEAICCQSVDVLHAMGRDSNVDLVELRVDGGAAKNDLLMQLQADLLNVPVARPKVTETTALGAAYLAGLAVNFWSSTDELTSHWQLDKRFEPCMTAEARDQVLDRWHNAVRRTVEWNRPRAKNVKLFI